jgi:hypothetical protein
MLRVLRVCLAAGFLFFAALNLYGQLDENQAKAQEDFALAVAKAHARTSLFGKSGKPVRIDATAVASLALHGVGTGTYENKWVDSQHWQRTLRFPDFRQTEIRNDDGHSWRAQSSDAMPARIAQMLRYVVIHIPSSTASAQYVVTESKAADELGESVTCFSATQPTPKDGFPRHFRWCFNSASGLLVSEDLPLNLHITYGKYVVFQGKDEFTEVHVTAGGLPVLDVKIRYSALDAHALDGLVPDPEMTRSESAESTPNPEETHRPTIEYRFHPVVPAGTPDDLKARPVLAFLHVNADGTILDASVEDAPTQAMGEAAIEAVRKYSFTPRTVDGQPKRSSFCTSIWFRTGAGADPSADQAVGRSPVQGVAPAASQAGSVYRNAELSFAFSYPAGFVPTPMGQLEEDLRRFESRHRYGLKPHEECDTLLFQAVRPHPTAATPQRISISVLDSACIFTALDLKVLGSIALNGAHSVIDSLADGQVSKPKQYTVGTRVFTVVTGSGIPHAYGAGTLNVLLVVAQIREQVVGWMVTGSGDDVAQSLAACRLQIDGQGEIPLFTMAANP